MKIALLGASGAIGGWIAERLIADGQQPRIVLRGSAGNRLSRHEHLDIVRADASDSSSLASAFANCDVVINCIIDKTPGLIDQQLVEKNVHVTQAILRACESAKVRRYIHVSSIVVLPPNVTQSNIQNPWAYSTERDWYTQAKIQTEKVVRDYSGTMELCIVRPGIVYGPLTGWSLLGYGVSSRGTMVVPNRDTESICHAVHIDDVARLCIHLALLKTTPPALVYAINPEKVRWETFYQRHSETTELPLITEHHSSEELLALSKSPAPFGRQMFNWLAFSPLFQRFMNQSWVYPTIQKIKHAFHVDSILVFPGTPPAPYRTRERMQPTRFDTLLLLCSGVFSDDEAGGNCGYTYAHSFDNGMQQTDEWYSYALKTPSSLAPEVQSTCSRTRPLPL